MRVAADRWASPAGDGASRAAAERRGPMAARFERGSVRNVYFAQL